MQGRHTVECTVPGISPGRATHFEGLCESAERARLANPGAHLLPPLRTMAEIWTTQEQLAVPVLAGGLVLFVCVQSGRGNFRILTYTRSASPLEGSWLPAIPGKGKSKKGANEEKRDTTWQIRIVGQTFQLQTDKGKKKMAVLPQHANLKGKVVLDKAEVLTSTKLGEIFKIAPFDPRRDYTTSWPKKRSYEIDADVDALCADHLGALYRKLTAVIET